MSRGGYENQFHKTAYILERVSERSTFVELAGVSHNLNKSVKTRWRRAGESPQILPQKKFKQRPVAPTIFQNPNREKSRRYKNIGVNELRTGEKEQRFKVQGEATGLKNPRVIRPHCQSHIKPSLACYADLPKHC